MSIGVKNIASLLVPLMLFGCGTGNGPDGGGLITRCNGPDCGGPTLDAINRANSYFSEFPANGIPRVGDIYTIQYSNNQGQLTLAQRGCHPDDSVATSTYFGPVVAGSAGDIAFISSKNIKANVDITAEVLKILEFAGVNVPGAPNLSAALSAGTNIISKANQKISNITIQTANNPINASIYYNNAVQTSPNCAGLKERKIQGYVLTKLQKADIIFDITYNINLSAEAKAEATAYLAAKLSSSNNIDSSTSFKGSGLVTGYQLVNPLYLDRVFGPKDMSALAAGERATLERSMVSAIKGQAVGVKKSEQLLTIK